jgi:hypothetical protein
MARHRRFLADVMQASHIHAHKLDPALGTEARQRRVGRMIHHYWNPATHSLD